MTRLLIPWNILHVSFQCNNAKGSIQTISALLEISSMKGLGVGSKNQMEIAAAVQWLSSSCVGGCQVHLRCNSVRDFSEGMFGAASPL